MDLRTYIRDIPDFPKEGIVFKDITPLMLDRAAFDEAIRRLADSVRGLGVVGFFGVWLSLVIGQAFSWDNWTGLAPPGSWLRVLRVPLLLFAVLCGTAAGLGMVSLAWAGRDGVASETPILQERARYELNSHGRRT